MNKKYTIYVEKMLDRGIHRESKKDVDENRTFMETIYQQAAKIVSHIYNNRNERELTGDIEGENPAFRQNVIAFNGRRGTGKTSAMVSFSNLLNDREYVGNHIKRNISFCSLSAFIDVSLFDNTSSLIRSILAQMNLDLRKAFNQSLRIYDGKIEALYQKARESIFETFKVYKKFNVSSNYAQSDESELEAQTDYLNVRNKLFNLVNDYLQFMTNSKDSVLVICIDDLDYAFNRQFDLMADIHRFLMLPNVLVMITANFSNLSIAIQNKMMNQFSLSYDSTEQTKILAHEQSLEFLKKMVPTDMRVTMPSWKKTDYKLLSSFEVDTTNYNTLPLFSTCDVRPPKTVTPKEFLLFLVAHRTKVYLDPLGHKLHFLEPDSLRDLYDKFNVFYNMESIKGDPDATDNYSHHTNQYTSLSLNRKILLDYLFFRIRPNLNLNEGERYFIEKLDSLEIERRGSEIRKFYYSKLAENENIKTRFGETFYNIEKKFESEENDSMGELFRVLFTASRIDVFSKDLVKYILALYSFTMPQYIETEKYKLRESSFQGSQDGYPTDSNDELSAIKTHIGNIEKVFKKSLIGDWYQICFYAHNNNWSRKNIRFQYNISQNTNQQDEQLKNLMGVILISRSFIVEGFEANPSDSGVQITINEIDPSSLSLNLLKLKHSKEMELGGYLGLNMDNPNEPKGIETVIQLYNLLLERKENLKGDGFNDSTFSFILKHIDITYNFIKRFMIKQIYYTDANPLTVKQMLPDPDNDSSFNISIRAFISSYFTNLQNTIKELKKVYNPENKNSGKEEVNDKEKDECKGTEKEYVLQAISQAWNEDTDENHPFNRIVCLITKSTTQKDFGTFVFTSSESTTKNSEECKVNDKKK